MPTDKKTAKQSWSSVFDMPLDELESRVAQADTLIQQALDLFPGLLVLTDQERKYSNGRFRAGEGKMYLTVLSVMEAFPTFFEELADSVGDGAILSSTRRIRSRSFGEARRVRRSIARRCNDSNTGRDSRRRELRSPRVSALDAAAPADRHGPARAAHAGLAGEGSGQGVQRSASHVSLNGHPRIHAFSLTA